MKRNLYLIKGIPQRSNPVKNFILNLFSSSSSLPKLLLECFVRKDFGERYFSLSTALIMAFVLCFVPPLFLFGSAWRMGWGDIIKEFILHYLTWYVFLAYFIRVCFLRKKEITRIDGEFDTTRYTFSTGNLDDRIMNFKFKGKGFNIRQVETIIEPGLFLLIGFVLMVLGQFVGILIFLSSIVYSLSYHLMYSLGDDFILDMIDNRIANQVMVSVFVDGVEDDPTGFRMRTRRPADQSLREDIAGDIIDDQPPYFAV